VSIALGSPVAIFEEAQPGANSVLELCVRNPVKVGARGVASLLKQHKNGAVFEMRFLIEAHYYLGLSNKYIAYCV
jgi:hypothetical protein